MIVTIRNGVVLDTSAMAFVGERTIVIEGEAIVDVLDTSGNIEADLDIDAGGRFVLPGFIDAHVHHVITTMDFARLQRLSATELAIGMASLAAATVQRGFTTVRDTGGAVGDLVRAIEGGLCSGPRIVRAGRTLSQTGGHGDFRSEPAPIPACGCQIDSNNLGHVVDGVDAVRKAARYELRAGSEFIKIMSSGGVASPSDPFDSVQFTAEEVEAITTETDHRHTYTTSHAYLPDAIRLAVDNGVRCIEHGNGLDRATADHLVELGVVVVPTLVTYKAMQEEGAKLGLPQISLDKNDGVFEMGLRAIGIAREAGVELGFGTDLLGETQVRQNDEFAIRGDLEPAADVLRSMYVTNAKLCRLEGRVGTLEPGALGDVVISEVDPLEELAQLARPDTNLPVIIQRGEPVKHLL
ncbi:MAG: amidohydrolase family protein [Acidimicrobiia bacterium]|nr:amidohydrolase family protein [Acidimicrobiia bacterium]